MAASPGPLRVGGKVFGRFLGNTVSAAAGFSAGAAIGPVLGPVVQAIRNTVNSQYAFVYPDPVILAEGVAQGQIAEKEAREFASYHGFGDEAMTALIAVANTGPGLGAAMDLWRRGEIDELGFRRAIKRLGLEQEWIDALVKVKPRLVDIADLARMIHRGLIPDPGLLQGQLPQREGKVPAYPVYPIDAVATAEGLGYSRDILGAMVGLQGNPMGPHEAANAEFRGVIDFDDYLRAISEGNTRNEWAQAIYEQSRQIPTARDFLENALRGYSTLQDALAGAAKHGMTTADATLIYQNQGRPMAISQITKALARGGKFNPEPGEITDPYMASIVEGSLKPAYYEFAETLKYQYPAFFQTVGALSKGWIDAPTATKWLLYQGYEPGAVETIVTNVGGPTAKTKKLTSAQIRSAVTAGQLTHAEGLARLMDDGYSQVDAEIILNNPGRIPPGGTTGAIPGA